MKTLCTLVLALTAISLFASQDDVDALVQKATGEVDRLSKNYSEQLERNARQDALMSRLEKRLNELENGKQSQPQAAVATPALAAPVSVPSKEDLWYGHHWNTGVVYPIKDNETNIVYRATYVGDDVQGRNGLRCKSLDAVSENSSEIGIKWTNFRSTDAGGSYFRYSVGSCGGVKRFQRAYAREFPKLAVIILSWAEMPQEQWPGVVHKCTCDQHPQGVVQPRVVETPRVAFREEERVVARRESCEPSCHPRIPCGSVYTYSSGGACPRYEACGPYRQECRPQVYQYPHSCGRPNQYYQPQRLNVLDSLRAQFGFGVSASAGIQANGGQQYRYRSF